VGKFAARQSSYVMDLLRGSDSIWLLILTTITNAGLFSFVLISTLVQCWRSRRFLSLEEVLLLLLIAAFFIVFSLPSQRSGRYLLPVMPAFAALIALFWDKLPLWSFRIALLLQLLVLSLLLWIGINLQFSQSMGDAAAAWTFSYFHWALMGVGVMLALLGLFKPSYSKTIALAACFLIYCALTSSLAPLEGRLGRYSTETIAQLQGKDIWIPCDYRAKDEEYRLLIPGAKLHGYLAKDAAELATLTATYPLVAVHLPLGAKPTLCDSCQIVGQRMEMRARHSNEEIQQMFLGQIGKHLFVTEYLISTPVSQPEIARQKDVCR